MKWMESTPWDVVVFDYGRVLSHSPTPAELQEFAKLVGIAEPPFYQIYSDTRDEYDCGRHSCEQHWQHFAKAAGISLTRGTYRKNRRFRKSHVGARQSRRD